MKKLIFGVGISMLITMNSSANNSSQLSNTQQAAQSFEQNSAQSLIQDIEGNVYRTVKIGDRVWLAENLRSTKFQDGTPVNTGFVPDDNDKNLSSYGRLYHWNDVSNSRNICPAGWRVASDEDWKSLETAIGIVESDLDKEGWRGEKDVAITLKAAQPTTW